jgi:hypothetical protein
MWSNYKSGFMGAGGMGWLQTCAQDFDMELLAACQIPGRKRGTAQLTNAAEMCCKLPTKTNLHLCILESG